MHKASSLDFRVVCIAGSAGGLHAYIQILRHLSADTGMAFVIAPHRGIEHADLLPAILRRATEMPVAEIEQGMELKPNHVFIMPPRTDMTTVKNTFHLHSAAGFAGWPKTISYFLFSLAADKGRAAVAVIVSGLDHDGIVALKAIKDAGGVTFAQADAQVNDMPRHAVETGYVDYLLTSMDIAKTLVALASEPLTSSS